MLQRWVFAVTGVQDSALQALPFLCSLLLIPCMAWAVRLFTGSLLASCGAGFLSVYPIFVNSYSVRVKPYTLDALCSALLLVLLGEYRQSRTSTRFVILCVGALALAWFSNMAAVMGLAVVGVVWFSMIREHGFTQRTKETAAAAATLGGIVVYGLVFIRPQANPFMLGYWRDYYIPLESWAALLRFCQGKLPAFFGQAYPHGVGWWLAPLTVLGAVYLWRERSARVIFWALALIVGALLLLSAMHRLPLEGGRTGVYFVPILLAVTASGLAFLERAPKIGKILGWALLAGVMALCLNSHKTLRISYQYPNTAKQTVDLLMEKIQPDDYFIIYPHSPWAVAYYGPWPYSVKPTDIFTHGFEIALKRERTLILPGATGDASEPFFSDKPEALFPLIDAFVRQVKHKGGRVLFLATFIHGDAHNRMIERIEQHGPHSKAFRELPTGVCYGYEF